MTMFREVLLQADSFVTHSSLPSKQQELIISALNRLQNDYVICPSIDIPLWTYCAIKKEPSSAIPLAAATALLFIGIDFMDDVADGDLLCHWFSFDPHLVHLTGMTLIASLVPIAFNRLEIPAATRLKLHEALSNGLLRMSAGQWKDLEMTGRSDVTLEEIEESIRGKSGEEVALFAALGAILAEAPSSIVEQYASLGKAIGVAAQIASDFHDLFQSEPCRDLMSGRRTLPIVFALTRKSGAARDAFLKDLEDVQTDSFRREEILTKIEQTGAKRFCSMLVETHCQEALTLLKAAVPDPIASGEFRNMIENISFFSKTRSTQNQERL